MVAMSMPLPFLSEFDTARLGNSKHTGCNYKDD